MVGMHSVLGSSSASPPRAGSGGIRRLRHHAADIEAVCIMIMGWCGLFRTFRVSTVGSHRPMFREPVPWSLAFRQHWS